MSDFYRVRIGNKVFLVSFHNNTVRTIEGEAIKTLKELYPRKFRRELEEDIVENFNFLEFTRFAKTEPHLKNRDWEKAFGLPKLL